MTEPSEERRTYQAYFVPHGDFPDKLAEIFAKVMTVFYNEGYEIIEIHELEKQAVTLIIFRLRND